jgi:phage terminase large subunit-like protein
VKSPAELLAEAPPDEQAAFIESLSPGEITRLLIDWHGFLARPEQIAPPEPARWLAWITGRGFGKNRTASEALVDRCEAFADARWPHLMGLISQTHDSVSSIQIHGESGIEKVCERRGYELEHAGSALHGRLIIPRAGYRHVTDIEVHTAVKPEKVRGRNLHTLHCDEVASWDHKIDSVGNTAWTNCDFALRAECPPGMQPLGIVTTTPKPIPQIRDITTGTLGGKIHVIRGSLLDNASNLAPEYVAAVLAKYEGTRVALQEIHGIVLDFVEGALWTPDLIQQHRLNPIRDVDLIPEFRRTVIGVDPSGSDGGDECGIVVVSLSAEPIQTLLASGLIVPMHHVYVRRDASCRVRPAEWVPKVVSLFHEFAADAVVLETNFGAAMGVDSIHQVDPMVNVVEVRASKGKVVRAEPVAMVYDQGRAHHIGHFSELEEQMSTWVPTDKTSPDRMDALVWACSFLLPEITQPPSRGVTPEEIVPSLPTGAAAAKRTPTRGMAA